MRPAPEKPGSANQVVRVDAAVVGLGPAGSTALRLLADAGISCIGLDRSTFPRNKACGGGISARTLPLLPPGILENIPHQITSGISLTFRGEGSQNQDFGRPIAYQVRRDQFDTFMIDAARSAGGQVVTGVEAISARQEGRGFVLTAGDMVIHARSIFAADGATSRILRDLDPGSSRHIRENPSLRPFTSAEAFGHLRHPIDNRHVAIDLGLVTGGYAWSFPKKDSSWGLGVAGFLGPLSDPRGEFARYLNSRKATVGDAEVLTWPLPNFRSVRHGRIPGLFLIGDAGAILDPFLGEGIYYAILSATRGAEELIRELSRKDVEPETAVARASTAYARFVKHALWPDFSQGARLAQVLYRFPGLFFRITRRHPGLLALYASILTGKHDYRSFSRAMILRALSLLIPGRTPLSGPAL